MNTTDLLAQVQAYENRLPNDPPANDKKLLIIYDMVQTVKTQTDNFSNPDAISTVAVDVRSILKRENVDPDIWVKEKGNFMRSEKQSLEWLADALKKHFDKPATPANNGKAKALALFKFKAAALKLKQTNSN